MNLRLGDFAIVLNEGYWKNKIVKVILPAGSCLVVAQPIDNPYKYGFNTNDLKKISNSLIKFI